MRLFPLFLVLSVAISYAEESISPNPVVRMSLGIPVLSVLGELGLEGRILVGSDASPWRFGGEAIGLSEFSFDQPSRGLSATNACLGYEFSPTGPVSVMLIGGLGWAKWTDHGALIPDEGMFHLGNTYESVKGSGPALLVETSAGSSFGRVLGISINGGVLLSHHPTAFADLMLDVGNW